MPESLSQDATRNLILSKLSGSDFGLLAPNLESVDLPTRRQLEARAKRIKNVYFIEGGFASMVANGSGERPIEVGIIGREGMSGLAVVMDNGRATHEIFMQAAGQGQSIKSADLLAAVTQSLSLFRAIAQFAHAFLIQTTQTALANGRSKLEERLARWLLMAADRLETDDLPLTHEFLGMMLGTPRPGVTIALQALERTGLITTRRGHITILDRATLEKRSNGAYARPA